MARIRVPLNNFAFGEINPSLTSRTDTPVYVSAAESVQNFFIRSEGGVVTRPGTKRIYNFTQTFDSSLTQQVRIEPFVFSDDEKYIIAFSSGKIECFRIHPTTGAITLAQTLTADVNSNAIPITNSNLTEFTFAQKGDFMFLAHTSFLCRELVRTGLTSFEVRVFSFETDVSGNRTYQPFYNFQTPGTRITSSSASSGTGRTLETSDVDGNDVAYFSSDHVGTKLLIGDAEATITAFTDSHTVTATLHDDIKVQLDIDALEAQGLDPINVSTDRYLDKDIVHPWTGEPVGLQYLADQNPMDHDNDGVTDEDSDGSGADRYDEDDDNDGRIDQFK